MSRVAITQDERIEVAIRAALEFMDVEKMEFPALTLARAIQIFTERAYGERLDFRHA